jgi:hypothetical protein
MMINLKNQGQSDGYFHGRNSQNKDKHHLSVGLIPVLRRNDKNQSGTVEHNFDGHKHEHQIPAYQQANKSQKEKNSGK